MKELKPNYTPQSNFCLRRGINAGAIVAGALCHVMADGVGRDNNNTKLKATIANKAIPPSSMVFGSVVTSSLLFNTCPFITV